MSVGVAVKGPTELMETAVLGCYLFGAAVEAAEVAAVGLYSWTSSTELTEKISKTAAAVVAVLLMPKTMILYCVKRSLTWSWKRH